MSQPEHKVASQSTSLLSRESDPTNTHRVSYSEAYCSGQGPLLKAPVPCQAGKAQALDSKVAGMQSERAAAIGEIASLKGEVTRLRSQLDHTASVSGDSQVRAA